MSETEVTTEAQVEVIDDLDAFTKDFFGQKSGDDKATATTVAAEQEATEDTEAQVNDAEDEAEAQEEIPDKPKRKTVQDRIDEVVRQREELKRESATQIEALRKELEDFKKSQTKGNITVSTETLEPQPDSLDANGDPTYALGEFDPQYIRDLTRFTLVQERAKVDAERAEAQRQSAAQQEQQTLQTSWNEKVTVAGQAYPDFQERGQELLNNFNNLEPSYAGYLTNVLMSMEKGPDVLYYLSNHPEEAIAIVNSGARNATLALGQIQSRFIPSEQTAAKPKITQAPVPPSVRARGTNGAFVSVAPDTDDLKAFETEFFRKK